MNTVERRIFQSRSRTLSFKHYKKYDLEKIKWKRLFTKVFLKD
jgi:hypothetical protein